MCEDYKSTQRASGAWDMQYFLIHFGLMDQPEKLIRILDINSISLDDNPMPKTPFALTAGGSSADSNSAVSA